MISYKRDVLVRKKIVEYFKNNVPQRQIAKAL